MSRKPAFSTGYVAAKIRKHTATKHARNNAGKKVQRDYYYFESTDVEQQELFDNLAVRVVRQIAVVVMNIAQDLLKNSIFTDADSNVIDDDDSRAANTIIRHVEHVLELITGHMYSGEVSVNRFVFYNSFTLTGRAPAIDPNPIDSIVIEIDANACEITVYPDKKVFTESYPFTASLNLGTGRLDLEQEIA